jgi:hypothetical protein
MPSTGKGRKQRRRTSRHSVQIRPRRRDLRVHVGDLALHELESADGLAELLAFVNV